jgi:uncharacterized protein (DUF427 family)
MGLSWQQGPLSPGAIGRFLVPESIPKRLLYAEPLRRRMRVRFAGTWIADSEHVILLFEPGRYPVAYFPETDVSPHTLERTDHTTQHPDLGPTSWYTVRTGEHAAPRGAWQHTGLPVRPALGNDIRPRTQLTICLRHPASCNPCRAACFLFQKPDCFVESHYQDRILCCRGGEVLLRSAKGLLLA